MGEMKFQHGFAFSNITLNQPFQAEFETIDRPTLAGGEPGQSSTTGRVYRDSRARRREEHSLEISPGVSFTLIAISDPAAGTLWAVENTNRTISVLRGQPMEPWEAQDKQDTQFDPRELQDKLIEGYSWKGGIDYESLKCYSHNFSSEDGTSSEILISVELMEVVFHRDVGPAGEKTHRLFNIDRTEPPADLFDLPEGYEVTELR